MGQDLDSVQQQGTEPSIMRESHSLGRIEPNSPALSSLGQSALLAPSENNRIADYQA
eukprot:CAMPEP_0185590968 /NCGR_PEP_ID=MMETSP0434-20130131/62828_1 /TAXON_ID=626734 ORGANISM="Favella taraikaensis, Strain Fe Narragansett Bay" /NCGR_SAMPLE_ID=MMETSP0434 /ASSEMBLY_ACC=CAM_ASM_000379 /LENGTH=56 /DNA_ID=CAMNT_0028215611 /DNA_START=1514 /DNA_END=1681 /DNA_ORIENTATION=-